MRIRPTNVIDFYKADHISQYPEGTEFVYSNFTPRSGKHAEAYFGSDWDHKVVVYGLQGYIKWFLKDTWDNEFFNQPKEKVVGYYKRRMDTSLGPNAVPVQHLEELHDLGFLPIRIRALPEGARSPIGVPVFTIENTLPNFFWLTNFLESVTSAELWKSMTNATIAYQYRKIIDRYAAETGAPPEFAALQGHDFSFRGMSGVHDSMGHGSAHLTSFVGTDTVAAIDYLEDYYNADAEQELIGCSVAATEHSVMCMGTKEDEIGTFRRLINDLYPTGIVSIVSDTWDFWKVITEYAPALKDEILRREPNALGLAKVVFRPDSGNPADIICGTVREFGQGTTPEEKGAVECLWETFGGSMTEKGFKMLHERVGLIYGDSITINIATEIMQRLKEKGFASSNIVLGIGSYTYQFSTRDTLGFAMKATYGVVNGEGREIFKDPVTDSGTKKSARGLLRVINDHGEYVLKDRQTFVDNSALVTVFEDGELLVDHTLAEIRERLNG